MLKFTQDNKPRVLERNKPRDLERQLKVFEDQSDQVLQLIVEVQEKRIQEGDEIDEIQAWSLDIEKRLEEFDETIDLLRKVIDSLNEQTAGEARQIEQKMEDQRRKQLHEIEISHEEKKLELRRKYEKKMEESQFKSMKEDKQSVKLSKLVITKFQGTHLDWQRFLNQFETEIDRAEIGQITKFSYLKELLVQKVHLAIDGLPFTVEGYERAKCILQTKYGNPSEVANTHIQSIISLPTIHGTNPGKIHEFYEKLVTNVQALDTMGKLREMNDYVRMTLDKLIGIRADLVRTDDNWQEWKFTHLVEALRKWTERNPLPMDHERSEHFDEKFNHKQPKRDRIFQSQTARLEASKNVHVLWCK